MDTITERYATRSVPRYTSYPTAPHFGPEVTGEVYAGWLRALPADTELSLYLHVPFCREMCHYCGCHTKVTHKDAPLYDYAEVLVREIAMISAMVPGGLPVSHIHWGGGTPSLLPDRAFRDVVEALQKGFSLADNLEHAIELDPRTVTPELAKTLGDCGITRASLGVQDFSYDVQQAIGRIQPKENVLDSVAALKANGINAINLDLMYGLPKQTVDTMRATAEAAAALQPSRLALFGYAHVPWMKKHQRLINEDDLPGVEMRLELATAARDALKSIGYHAIGLDHFAHNDDSMAIADREGTLHRNFQGYTTDGADALIGFGVSSIGKLPQGYAQNAPDIGGWKRAVDAGMPPIVRGKALSEDDRTRAAIIERLMTVYDVDLAEIATHFHRDPADFHESLEQLDELVADGLVDVDGYHVTVRPAGRPYVRVAAAAFDTYFAANKARHSVAV
ncbi:oxygen-independent coproporphyrinogen-3 oxidase [Rhodobium orientis]|uniref:Coproporphyrinogen-III oxidase n=1 Tax=Rhodobium orientis TaxID=34017 RepID=A0A327JEX8_9HYPH|nr:oxygen-independent coproporphyrinogen III oxidase [Rhodobium orientis]MBB4305301.1 oxygen-independent coproporphyrinogen-3 oxidase [Rhodobium orientis]MBK5949636.1 oxygen-independent coproporphyrinogen III oxidase [Rhodobium orientis]RAI23219.1 oxygen-independent coproporphyrinogen III oxidase [Rhodobium orientis]